LEDGNIIYPLDINIPQKVLIKKHCNEVMLELLFYLTLTESIQTIDINFYHLLSCTFR